MVDEYNIEALNRFLSASHVGHTVARRIIAEATNRSSRPGFIPGHRLGDAIRAGIPDMKEVDVATLVVECHGVLAESVSEETAT